MANALVPTDSIFQSVGKTGRNRGGDGDQDDDYSAEIRARIEDARSFDVEWLAPDREEAQRYYDGIEPYLDEEGRSTIVATEVKDTVLAMLPSLIRIFTAAENPVEYVPNHEAEVEFAEQATDYAAYVFYEENEGYLLLHSVLKDALIKKMGITRWRTEVIKESRQYEYRGVNKEQFQYIISQDGMEVMNAEPSKTAPKNGEPRLDVTCRLLKTCNKTIVEAIPPDEFRINRTARSIDDARLVGTERLVSAGSLIARGYDPETVGKYAGGSAADLRWSEERTLRNPALQMEGAGAVDDNMVLYGEYYIRIDADGDGIDELHHICTMGDNDEIVHDEPCDGINYSIWNCDPIPHTVVGDSVADQTMDLQRIKTNILRNSLDSIAQTIFPRTVVVENMVNIADVLNQELGQVIRAKDINAVKQLDVQFIGEAAFTMIQYLDTVRQGRTGITEASKGLDPKALQSTTMKGVDMVITGAQERTELIARTLAETGMKQMFKGLLREFVNNPSPEKTIKLRGKWVNVNPGDYDPTMGVRVNPSMGKGSDMDRMLILSQVKQTQEQILLQMGPNNPLCGPIEYRNTLDDLLSIAGVKNTSRYFKRMSQQDVDQFIQQMSSKPDPATLLANAQMEEIKAKTTAKIADVGQKDKKMEMDDDFRRDKLETDAILHIAEILGQYGIKVDTANIQATMTADRRINSEAKRLVNDQQRAEDSESGGEGGASSERPEPPIQSSIPGPTGGGTFPGPQ